MKVLITDKVHQLLPKALIEKGWKVDYNTTISLDEVHNSIHNYDGIVINSKILMDRALIEKGKKLTFVARLGSGMEIVDIPHARSKGIRIINASEGNSNAVAEHAMGMLLMLANNLNKGNEEVKRFYWDREGNRGFELKGKTIGIIGVGHTGSALASKLVNWGVKVLGYDKYKFNYGSECDVIETNLETVLEESDIISFHLPLTEEVIHMCNEDFLNRCKHGVIIINTSRGKVIDTRALIKALEKDQVGGACLDVFENEKPKNYSSEEKTLYKSLFSISNVIVTPHVAGWTHESLEGIARLVLKRIETGYTMEA
ncbi:MAG: hydroxyacid dehydrogenase [Saprospiraceae bacterium]|nr:hydroxyacid dehydrogenase [Saprospiraceae bacterium]